MRKNHGYKKAKEILSILPCKNIGGYDIAIKRAENYRQLRKNGMTVRKTIDIIIGTFCIVENIPSLHDNRDFDPMTEHLALKAINLKP